MASEQNAEMPFKMERANLVDEANGDALPEHDPLMQLARLIGLEDERANQSADKSNNPDSGVALDLESQLIQELAIGDAPANIDAPTVAETSVPDDIAAAFRAPDEPQQENQNDPVGDEIHIQKASDNIASVKQSLAGNLEVPEISDLPDALEPSGIAETEVEEQLTSPPQVLQDLLSEKLATPASIPIDMESEFERAFEKSFSDEPVVSAEEDISPSAGVPSVPEVIGTTELLDNSEEFEPRTEMLSDITSDESDLSAAESVADEADEFANAFSKELNAVSSGNEGSDQPDYQEPGVQLAETLEQAVTNDTTDIIEVDSQFDAALAHLNSVTASSDETVAASFAPEPDERDSEPQIQNLGPSFLEVLEDPQPEVSSLPALPVENATSADGGSPDEFQLNTGGIDIGMSTVLPPSAPAPEEIDPIDAALNELANAAKATDEDGWGDGQSNTPATADIAVPGTIIAAGAAAVASARRDAGTAQFDQTGAASFDANNSAEHLPIAPVGEFDVEAPVAATMADEMTESKRSYRVAAAILVIALIGGGAALTWNFIGGDPTAERTKIVLASPDPVKVKPDQPGGKVIPNQNQAVFNEISGTNKTASQQESLKSGAESPLDVAPFSPKSSERLSASNNNSSAGNNLTIQPRRVRTVVVKPDGTIVSAPPRPVRNIANSEVANATPTAVSSPVKNTDGTMTEKLPNPAIKSGEKIVETTMVSPKTATPAAIKLDKFDGGTMATGAIGLPTLRNPADAPVQPVPAKPAKQVAVAKPVPLVNTVPKTVATPAAKTPAVAKSTVPAGSWVMQISSQRSAEAAQSTYRSLKRRFASVLGDRGVDIRRATIKDKGIFYRVRIPAGSKKQAASLCSKYKSAGGSCYITR